jgi:uroporphyrin-III C-methyltransferase
VGETPAGGEVPRRGSLTVVGTGIDAVSQLTPGARGAIEGADEVLYLVADPVAALRVEALSPRARSLDHFYGPTKARRETYAEVAETIVGAVMRGARVCAVLYGHPGVFALPGHTALERVRAAGLPARMLPAVSALDCLVADLGLDPARWGLQAYEATYFFVRRPSVDPHATLVLLQVGMLGEAGGAATEAVAARFHLLLDRLVGLYGPAREAILYEASPYPGTAPAVDRFALGDAEARAPSVMSTLCVPGQDWPPVDPDARRALELSGG